MAQQLLMPKATAVWLVDNTALTFEQISEFCKLHTLEVKAIADGESAQGIKGLDPIQTGQLSARRDQGRRGRSGAQAETVEPQGARAGTEAQGPALHAGQQAAGPPNAILWLVRNHPELRDAQISRLVGTTKSTIEADPRPHPLELGQPDAARPGDAGLCTQIDLDMEVEKAAKERPSEVIKREDDTLLPAKETEGFAFDTSPPKKQEEEPSMPMRSSPSSSR